MLKTRGLWITFEGIDGCGKTTQAELLKINLDHAGYTAQFVREPGGTAVGEAVREILLDKRATIGLQTELLLYMAARSELSEQIILPALKKGTHVICDRFGDSTMAYQGYGGGVELNWVALLNRRVSRNNLPDTTFLLDLSVDQAAARRSNDPDRMESRSFYYHRRVREGYLAIARRNPHRFTIIDAAENEERLASKIWQKVKQLLEDSQARRCYE